MKMTIKTEIQQICKDQKLKIDFKSKTWHQQFKDLVKWEYISRFQKLSENFIQEHKDLVNWDIISYSQKLSENFIKKHKLTIKNTNWLYKTENEKLEYIKNKTTYKILNDKIGSYIIAYKGIRSDRYSKFNFQYQYLKGESYESNCDCNQDNENSFGLSAWSKEKATKYCNELVVKTKIYVKDIGTFVHDNNKIRCFKQKILD